jgi:transposase
LHKTIQEAEINEAVIIADKGFYSNINIEFLGQNGLGYIPKFADRNGRIPL